MNTLDDKLQKWGQSRNQELRNGDAIVRQVEELIKDELPGYADASRPVRLVWMFAVAASFAIGLCTWVMGLDRPAVHQEQMEVAEHDPAVPSEPLRVIRVFELSTMVQDDFGMEPDDMLVPLARYRNLIDKAELVSGDL